MTLGISLFWIAVITLILAREYFNDKGDDK